MKLRFAILASMAAMTMGARAADSQKPDWAYAVPLPGAERTAPVTSKEMLGLPGSKLHFTRNKIQGLADDGSKTRVAPADWFPDEHPAMPPIVAQGDNARAIGACSWCHMPNGRGRPENASLAGQPADYIVQQMHDLRDGLRQSAEPRKLNAREMVDFAKAMTEGEIQSAAAYFSGLPWKTPWVRVVESTTAPKVVSHIGLWIPLTGAAAGQEPLGDRIIEVPVNPEQTEIRRSPHSSFIAYVPVGSLAEGKRLVTSGGGKTTACGACHGASLGGAGSIPGLAGRSPSYIVRQLYDIQQGARHGVATQMMKPVVAKLSTHDILTIAAYIGSLPPATAP